MHHIIMYYTSFKLFYLFLCFERQEKLPFGSSQQSGQDQIDGWSQLLNWVSHVDGRDPSTGSPMWMAGIHALEPSTNASYCALARGWT